MEEKIYGLYPAGLNEKKVYEATELDTWLRIYRLGGQLFWLRHEWADGRLDAPYEDVKKEEETLQYQIEYLVYSLKRFGVKFDAEPKAGEHIKKNDESYWKWYNHWDKHLSNMPKDKYNEFCKLKKEGKDISEYLPKTKWNEDELTTNQTL